MSQAGLLESNIKGGQALIVSNETVAPLYLDALKSILPGVQHAEIILPDGEQHKTLATVQLIYDKLLNDRCGRSTTLIALGGGVVGDITGFAAATYQRGVNFVQIPTTLLAQVDSSVGGKTGVNHPLGKNMIGAFHQPQCVIADTDTLNTLPDRELRAGLAEVIKYALINDIEFFHWLEDNIALLLRRNTQSLAIAIKKCCENKAAIVALDEKEKGLRALLNLGHTFGHAIETASGYGVYLHGEAIAIGLVMAADLSYRLRWIGQQEAKQVKKLIKLAGLPVVPPADIDAEKFILLMSLDKKVQAGKNRFILMKQLGESLIHSDIDEALLRQTLLAGDSLCELESH